MGRNNQQHRAAKKRRNKQGPNSSRRQHSQGRPSPIRSRPDYAAQAPVPAEHNTGAHSPGEHNTGEHNTGEYSPGEYNSYDRIQWTQRIQGLIDRGSRLTEARGGALNEVIGDLLVAERQAPAPAARPSRMLTEGLLNLIATAWERGWQPRDLIHAMTRVARGLGELTAAAVAEQARRSGARQLAPPAWLTQLEDLTPEQDITTTGTAPPWRAVRWTEPIESWRRALRLLHRIGQLHRLPLLGPPPSQWRPPQGAQHRQGSQQRQGSQHGQRSQANRPSSRPAVGDDKILKRIRALLSKAEATDYPAEAEAFTAKAQDLMTRHSIDEALLRADDGIEITTDARRIHLDDPYALMKAGLLSVVGQANRVRSVWDGTGGFATVVGLPVDLEQVEMLFVSLLIQATRAMTAAGADQRSHSVDRSRSFRQSFLMAYASRIGQRLAAAAESATASYGTDLVPIFARQEEAVTEAFEELFPNTRQGGSSSRVNLRGWQAGSAAADEAVLPVGRIEGTG